MSSEDPTVRALRKDEHVRLAVGQTPEARARSPFDDLEFLHHALAGVDPGSVDVGVQVGDWRWPTPFYLNGMTGGTDMTLRINREFAIAARETGMPMASGSVSVALDDARAARSFSVIRQENPDGFVMANLGVDRTADDAVRAVELLEADALQVHVNAVQETVMPEGARNFSTWARSLEKIVAATPVPVIVKEVGFGLSRRTLTRLGEMGVLVADVSGTGGTDFLEIENARRTTADFSMMKGFGQSGLACLLDAPANGPQLLGSGGVRNPYDAVKLLAAGAKAAGVAGVFLRAVLDGGATELVVLVRQWLDQFRAILGLLGAEDAAALTGTDVLIRGRLLEFCQLRGIDAGALSRRSSAGRE